MTDHNHVSVGGSHDDPSDELDTVTSAHSGTSETLPESSSIDLYWRPGCGFCSSLRRALDELGIERTEHNIWDDPDHAATVRRYANGNETVPTVVIDDVGLVNPSVRELAAHLAKYRPDLLPDGFAAPTRRGPAHLLGRVFG